MRGVAESAEKGEKIDSCGGVGAFRPNPLKGGWFAGYGENHPSRQTIFTIGGRNSAFSAGNVSVYLFLLLKRKQRW